MTRRSLSGVGVRQTRKDLPMGGGSDWADNLRYMGYYGIRVDSEWLSSRTSFQFEDEVLDTSEP